MRPRRVAQGGPHHDAAARSRVLFTASRTRVTVMVAAAAVVAAAVGTFGKWLYAPLAGWDTAALVFGVWAWLAIGTFDAAKTAAHATREEPGRTVTDLIVLVAAIASLAAVGVIVGKANSATGATQGWLAGFGVASVALSWFAIHTLFTLRYARLYFRGADGGVNFNQAAPPRYMDFAYLAFTLGMTFQVSDTDIENTAIRATALRHALLSYLFGAVILAATVNLVASLGSGGS
jgi:uncharacterized membrane protein